MVLTPDSRPTIAFQGESGAFSELAACEFFGGDIALLPCESFAAMFAAVEKGAADCGMAAVENSLAGSIHTVWDLLVQHRPTVLGQIQLQIRHCLIAAAGTRLEEVERVYSHEQALAQCQDFLTGLEGAQSEVYYDTAGAVKMLQEKQLPRAAAIASAQAAAVYNMAILAEDIQTDPENFTRFLVIGHWPAVSAKPEQTTIVFDLPQRGGAVLEVLAPLEKHRLKTLKVESRKVQGKPWLFRFYVEFEGGMGQKPVEEALSQMQAQVDAWHFVGTYPKGRFSRAKLHR